MLGRSLSTVNVSPPTWWLRPHAQIRSTDRKPQTQKNRGDLFCSERRMRYRKRLGNESDLNESAAFWSLSTTKALEFNGVERV